MKFIKLNNIQAKRISGKEDEFNANDPRFIEENFYIVILEDLLPIAKRYIESLVVTVIDMANSSDLDVIKLNSVFNETDSEANTRIATRITKWDYTKIDIKEEL